MMRKGVINSLIPWILFAIALFVFGMLAYNLGVAPDQPDGPVNKTLDFFETVSGNFQ